MSNPEFIYQNEGVWEGEAPPRKMVLRIKNKGFSLKSFIFFVQKSGF
jgi:hypothetical protein